MRVEEFRTRVLSWYAENRRSFPWRETRDPWAILVSELMLQQTQTHRVLPKYEAFMAAFPGPEALDAAPLAELLRLWSGLGYNRRALALKKAAGEILGRHGGRIPDDEASLLALPGVGIYTARALLAFAFDRPVVLIETNVRTVFIHEFFPSRESVHDREIEPLVAAALDRADPRNWYYALMDYGVMIKAGNPNPGRRSSHHARQTPFADSHRRVRGEILKNLGGEKAGLSADALAARLPFARERVEKALGELIAEGFVAEMPGGYGLAE
ncbi:MAG TPA: A/G-specific adenine glycosylase [Rectinemataceae bacterium]|nr:A/G-specific adenine glycosylase [Rectinemataceae bacterium]